MTGIKEIFDEYGADYETTMNRFLNNEEMYIRLLGMLFLDDNLEKLGRALEAKDFGSAFEAAHTLKGVVVNLGLTPYYNAVSAIVDRLRDNGPQSGCDELYRLVCMESQRAKDFWNKLESAQ